MRNILEFIVNVLTILGYASLPIAAVYFGLEFWINDVEFKLALWGAVKLFLALASVYIASFIRFFWVK